MNFGFQTEEFMSRLESYAESIPDTIICMANILKEMIQEIESPAPEDIEKLHRDLRTHVSSAEALITLCGDNGDLCCNCPFGAYLPDGVSHASREAPFCLPWIAIGQSASAKASDQAPPR